MSKFGTYSIISAIILMLLPDILAVFGVSDVMTETFWPITVMSLGGLGILLHLISLAQQNRISLSAIVLLLSIGLIISGVSGSALEIDWSNYLTLLGLLLIAAWIAIPQKKSNKKADQD